MIQFSPVRLEVLEYIIIYLMLLISLIPVFAISRSKDTP